MTIRDTTTLDVPSGFTSLRSPSARSMAASGTAPSSAPAAPRPLPAPRPAPLPGGDTLAALDAVETRAWADLYEAAPDAIKRAAGLSLARRDGLVVAAAAAYDVLAFSRVLGAEPPAPVVDGEALARLAEHYRRLGLARAFLPWPASFRPPRPPALPAGTAATCVFHNRWVKLWRDAAPPATVRSRLGFQPLDAAYAEEAADVLASAFDFPPPLAGLFAAAIGRPRWRHFGLFDGPRLVAVAGLFLGGDTAWLGPAATRPSHRGRGAQQELLARRIEAAAQAGARLLTVETAEPTADRPVASYRNVRRLGFEELYRRSNYLFSLA